MAAPAETAVTAWIEKQANIYLDHLNCDVHRLPYSSARRSSLVQGYDFTARYVEDLPRILDMDSIAASGISLGVDPLGGASLSLWEPIAERYKLLLTVVNKVIDPTFRFVPCDKGRQDQDGLLFAVCHEWPARYARPLRPGLCL